MTNKPLPLFIGLFLILVLGLAISIMAHKHQQATTARKQRVRSICNQAHTLCELLNGIYSIGIDLSIFQLITQQFVTLLAEGRTLDPKHPQLQLLANQAIQFSQVNETLPAQKIDEIQILQKTNQYINSAANIVEEAKLQHKLTHSKATEIRQQLIKFKADLEINYYLNESQRYLDKGQNGLSINKLNQAADLIQKHPILNADQKQKQLSEIKSNKQETLRRMHSLKKEEDITIDQKTNKT